MAEDKVKVASVQRSVSMAAQSVIARGVPPATTAFHSPVYHELRDNPLFEVDGLQRLSDTLTQLEDAHGRLSYMMREVSSLLRQR